MKRIVVIVGIVLLLAGAVAIRLAVKGRGGCAEPPPPPTTAERECGGSETAVNETAAKPECRPTRRGTFGWHIKFNRDVSASRVAALEAKCGIRAAGFFNARMIRAEGTEAQISAVRAEPDVDSVTAEKPVNKISPSLLARTGTVPVRIVPETAADADAVVAELLSRGGIHVETNEEGVRGVMNVTNTFDIAALGEVRWIEANDPKRLFNNVAVGPTLLNVSAVRAAPLGLTGREQVISTGDSGIDSGVVDSSMHPDFTNDNVVAIVQFGTRVYDSEIGKWVKSSHTADLVGHGTHTAGSIAGSGAASGGLYRGVAFGAKLYAANFCDDDNLGYVLTPEVSKYFGMGRAKYDIAIGSHSWGDPNCEYNSESQNIDLYCWKHPEFLPVFSAGNEGQDGDGTVSPQAGAKNVLSVGATQTDRSEKGAKYGCYPNRIAYFSSRGPMPDGRIKPDVVGPGVFIASCKSRQPSAKYYEWPDGWGLIDGYYAWNSGTSMSTPLVAGTVALVREWLMTHRGFGSKVPPTSALMKAIVMGGATDLFRCANSNVTSAAPNNQEGWGRVNLAESIAPTGGRAVRLYDRIACESEVWTREITTTNDAPLDVQLVWIDYPATLVNTNDKSVKTLVNDFDLEVTDGVTTWLGNGGPERDSLNNAESVRIATAPSGVYRISVIPRSVLRPGGAVALYLRAALRQDAFCVFIQ